MSNQAKPQYFPKQAYINSKCMQFEEGYEDLGVALWHETKGIMCDGCPLFHKGKCASFLELVGNKILADKNSSNKVYLETVCTEAKRRGVSTRQVRIERRDRK